MARTWQTTPAQRSALDALILQAKVGATVYDARSFPQVFEEIGIRQRTSPRNELLGTTFTRPDDQHGV